MRDPDDGPGIAGFFDDDIDLALAQLAFESAQEGDFFASTGFASV